MRLFIALESSPEVKAWVGEVVAALTPRGGGLRWVAAENAHLTLAFLGEQSGDGVPAMKEAMRAAVSGRAPFPLRFGGLGAFDSWDRARVVWVDLQEGREPLAALAEALSKELDARRFPVEKREFKAHLTLARSRDRRPGPQDRLREAAAAIPPAPAARAEALALMRSHLDPKGARYETLWRCPLG